MNDRCADFDAIRAFARQGDQQAFAALARRHLDLVYAVALRKVSDPGAAQEISQTVFASLARKAWSFGPDDSLPAWLHRTTLLEAKQWWRGELRRRRREETAAQLGTTMKSPDDQPALHALVPLLDEALLSLRETDRTALLLRYYESRSLRDVGESIGVREDAAQKRVAGALEALTRFFQRRGYRTATVPAAAAALQQSATAAPAAVAASIFQTALQTTPPALGALTMLLARLASLSKVQTAAACLALAAVPIAWQCNTIQDMQQQITVVQNQTTLARSHQQELNVRVRNLEPELIRLQAALADADQADADRAAYQRRLLALRERIRGMLSDPNYHWPDDLPFVRIPKFAVSAMDFGSAILPPGIVKPQTRELLGLSPEERQAMEAALARYYANLDRHVTASAYETNRSSYIEFLPHGVKDSTIFVVPPLGEDISEAIDQMFADLAATLGEERWKIFRKGTNYNGTHTLRRILGLDSAHGSMEVGVWVRDADGKNPQPTAGYAWHDSDGTGMSSGNLDLSLFLPGAEIKDPQAAELKDFYFLSDTLSVRALEWLGARATTMLANTSRP